VVAVLDWELSTLGHPLADVAYNCVPYHTGPGDNLGGVEGVDLADLGIPGEEEYVATYCRRVGRPGIEDWDFYVAFALFRLAAIAQGIMGRVVAGTANDPNARLRGERARPLADAAWTVVERRGV
jgi:aminoglycoside phosphotransferase (APT) family kinase protein